MNRHRYRTPGKAVVIAAAVVATLVSAAAAATFDMLAPTANSVKCRDNPESGPTVDPGNCRTENTAWNYYMDSAGEFELESEDRSAVNAALKAWDDATVMKRSYDSSPTFEGTGETDIIFQEGRVPGAPDTLEGITWCVDIVDGKPNDCDSFYIRIRGYGTYDKWLVAHESGHTLGLTHGKEASPRKAESDSILGIMTADELPSHLGSTPISQVNKFYG